MTSDAELTRAKLMPVDKDSGQPKTAEAIDVHFNPVSLKVSLSNTLKADKKAKSPSEKAAQFVEKSSSKLSVDLIFDTSLEVTDVRLVTKKIALAFVAPQQVEGQDKPDPPQRCLFQWGAFAFEGMVQSYNETLDFFAAEGVPLRATVSLSLLENDFQFKTEDVKAAEREQPNFTPTSPGASADKATQEAGKDPTAWRDTAMFNGMESPRFSASAGLSVPGVSASAGISAGASFGASASLGAGIEGSFPKLDGDLELSSGAAVGVGGTVSAGLGQVSAGASLEAGASAEVGAEASASAGGGLFAGAGRR